MFRLEYYKPEHSEFETVEGSGRRPDSDKLLEGRTLFDDDVPVACGGVLLDDGMAWAWLLMNKDYDNPPMITLFKMFRLVVLQAATQLPVRCIVRRGFDKGEKLVDMLGFKEIGEIDMETKYGVYEWLA